jgi:hypothetical protein
VFSIPFLFWLYFVICCVVLCCVVLRCVVLSCFAPAPAPAFARPPASRLILQRNVKEPRVLSQACAPPPVRALPETASYALQLEVVEGVGLEGGFNEYQCDVAWGHSMTGGDSVRSLCPLPLPLPAPVWL